MTRGVKEEEEEGERRDTRSQHDVELRGQQPVGQRVERLTREVWMPTYTEGFAGNTSAEKC